MMVIHVHYTQKLPRENSLSNDTNPNIKMYFVKNVTNSDKTIL